MCFGFLAILISVTVLRKMAARLSRGAGAAANLSQFTSVQKLLTIIFMSSTIGELTAPGFKVFPVVGLVAATSVVAEGWSYFIFFKRASDKSFRSVAISRRSQSTSHLNLATIKRAQRARKNLGASMAAVLVIVNIGFVVYILLSPLWPANDTSSRECQVRLLAISPLSTPFFPALCAVV
jgi:hypothetical protein